MNERFPLPSPAPEQPAVETQRKPDARELKPEAAENPRIQRLIQARDEAARQLQEAIIDLETRESDPLFHKEKNLQRAGWMVSSHLSDGIWEGYVFNDLTGEKTSLIDSDSEAPLEKSTGMINFAMKFDFPETEAEKIFDYIEQLSEERF